MRAWLVIGCVLACTAASAAAAETRVPHPVRVIYPGELLTETVLEDGPVEGPLLDTVAHSSAELVGKSALRTLLPGKPVPIVAVGQPPVVVAGKLVEAIYLDGGLSIRLLVVPLQNGRSGELIRARNPDSGHTVLGTVTADGQLQVSPQ